MTLRWPLLLLLLVSLLSLGARAALIGEPCRSPCRTATDHLLIFDEVYYVNAARRIVGLPVPPDQPYARAPGGVDPNAEHPQLAKLIIAGSIEALGDGPWAWRLGSIVLGSLAILGMFALVRAAGGSEWLALGAATLMALDNLMLVHSRIATLDVYVLAAMLWAAVLYLHGRPWTAGALVAVGACMKIVAPYLLIVFASLEGLRLLAQRPHAAVRGALMRLGACAAAALGVFFGLLALLDSLAPPYDDSAHGRISGGPLAHLSHIVRFGAGQTNHNGAHGIASYPWQWLGDFKPITYLNIVPAHRPGAFAGVHPAVHFTGFISPPILLLAVPALIAALWRLRRGAGDVERLTLAWFAGTFGVFELLSLALGRTSYLYYMVIVMPGIYVAVARLLERHWRHRRLIALWWITVAAATTVLYPFTPLP